MTVPPSPWLTVKEAAQYARCSVNRIYAALGSGALDGAQAPGFRSQWLTTTTDLDNWIIARDPRTIKE